MLYVSLGFVGNVGSCTKINRPVDIITVVGVNIKPLKDKSVDIITVVGVKIKPLKDKCKCFTQ